MSNISSYEQTFSPFFIVSLKKDLTSASEQIPREKIASFEFEEDVKKADLLLLTIIDPTFALLDSGKVDPGNLIEFSFGHVNGHKRLTRTHVIMDVEPDFTHTGQPMFIVRAYDFAMVMGANYRSKNWGKISRSEIATQIALRNGLIAEVDDSLPLKRDIMQPPSMSDMLFLLSMAKELNFVCYVEDATLFFKKKGFDAAPLVTYIYRNPTGANTVGTLLSFKPHMKLHNRPAVEGLSDGINEQEAKSGTSKQTLLTDKAFTLIDDTSGAESEFVKPGSPFGKKQDPAPIGDQQRFKTQAQSRVDFANEKNIKGTAETIGDALISKNVNINFEGLGKRFSGLWYVENVRHRIANANSYMTTINVNRQGVLGQPTDQVQQAENEKVNKLPLKTTITIGIDDLSGDQVK